MEANIEKIIQAEIAGKIIGSMKPEEITQLLEASLSKTLKEVLSPWNIEGAIKNDVQNYLEEYLKNPEVQDRIKASTMKCADELMSGVIAVIISNSQKGIKSDYSNFIGNVSYDSILATVRAAREVNTHNHLGD